MLANQSVKNGHDLSLKLDSTLQELPVWDVEVEIHLPGNKLISFFEHEPLLPGVILTDNQKFVGMISRQRFFECMSRPYSFGLFSMRPIESLYNFLQAQIFIFPAHKLVTETTQEALQRSPQFVYEPILVKSASGKHEVLDFHQLLLANSQIHALTLEKLQHVKKQSRIAKAGFRDLQNNYTQLLQNEKMAALGQLVAGIAHEVNNPINFIAGNLVHTIDYTQQLLNLINLYQHNYPHPVEEITTAIAESELGFISHDLPNLLTSMRSGCDRIVQIIRSLRNFSRLDESDRKLVDIHEGIDSTLLILQSRLKNPNITHPINVIKEYENLPLVDCYAGLLNQVFMNLLSNAIDALEEAIVKYSGMVTKPQIIIRTEIIDDQQVVIRIADNGIGIPEEAKQRLFDPFFTTKPVGKGTGLGLSICHQIIVEKHGGQMDCISSLGKGAEFIIKIPLKFKVVGK
ncbi:ATP-binding protein [Anabaena sp. FACHB-709]|uniref:histidine kinase n=2 Tax=Nostocaceae TaxID=1162 RepID=A0A1Z4KJT0_ANAVA|nr:MULTISPECIES: ATP-binding protein [Nostocaceae]BAY69174.1 two-component sensor histidine kinase [Trichormus variabilis NIES-23]HBW33128.1 ATPase [Nostoc sp. UBA8866]MBD2174926.1 GHKL domain-containing protein [Anabaena cylindrica FACHB-318]MBD2266724.1 GHKL domain-containing protein [Anabaena sp. FACHB-709]MBD2276295.1 GHKL domain-containing protein [Nostoc sp. PCC 7120 = FACHB-418]